MSVVEIDGPEGEQSPEASLDETTPPIVDQQIREQGPEAGETA